MDTISGKIDLCYVLCILPVRRVQGLETTFIMGTQLPGVAVSVMPKFHAELAEECVDYIWAHSKHSTKACHCLGNEDKPTIPNT